MGHSRKSSGLDRAGGRGERDGKDGASGELARFAA
jgi:hypothetical protein